MTTSHFPREAALLLVPPYDRLTAVDLASPDQPDQRGWVMVWNLGSESWNDARHLVVNRAAGLPLAVILPESDDHLSVLRVLQAIERSRPQAVLPFHRTPRPREIASVVRRAPSSLATSVTDYLAWRGFTLDTVTRSVIHRTVELSSRVRTMSALATHLYMSRRAVGRRFRNSQLPVPSHWLHIGRVLRATINLQNSDATLFNIACSLGYPDGFALSNQMQRLCGLRPQTVRDLIGWEWVFESWIQMEGAAGNIAPGVLEARRCIAGLSAHVDDPGQELAGPDRAASI